MSEEPPLESVLELLTDEHARMILEATSIETLSANELAEHCDVSKQTLYRRLERLEEAGLVNDETRVRKDGHHDTVYTATLEHVSITLSDGSFEFKVDRGSTDAADRLTELWRNF